jgi:hypothetical protein
MHKIDEESWKALKECKEATSQRVDVASLTQRLSLA